MEYTNYKKLLDKIGREFVDDLKRELLAAGKDSSGALIRSLRYEVTQSGDNYWYINIIAEDYLVYVDKGRRPGKMPPIKKIKPWVERQGIKIIGKNGNPISTESAAYLIARSIGENGIKATNIVDRVRRDVFSKYESDIKKALGDDYVEYIKKELIKI